MACDSSWNSGLRTKLRSMDSAMTSYCDFNQQVKLSVTYSFMHEIFPLDFITERLKNGFTQTAASEALFLLCLSGSLMLNPILKSYIHFFAFNDELLCSFVEEIPL